MTELERLITELCPDGVEYKKTADLCIDKFWLMPATPNYIDSGIPYITSKNIRDNCIDFDNISYVTEEDYINMSKNRPIKNGDLLITMIGTIGEAAFVNTDALFYGQNMYLLRLDTSKIVPMFYYYFLTSPKIKEGLISKKNPSSQGYIKAGSIDNLLIPVPPLEVQREIVRILDNFTLLTAELTTELTARQKQYEHYRNSLLSLDENCPMNKTIKELCPDGVEYRKIGDLTTYEQPAKYIVHNTDYNDDFDIPVLTAGQSFILGYTNETDGLYSATKEDPVIIFDDFTGAFKWVDFTFKVKSSAMKMLKANANLTTLRYLYHVMGFLNYTSSEHKRLWISIYSEFMVPVPPLEVQREIVRILDNFTELTTELTAEITARQKQYEYYRDKLLTFKELKV